MQYIRRCGLGFMNIKTWHITLLIFIACLVAGCATVVKVKDHLPSNVPKGYVQFYVVTNRGWATVEVLQVRDGKKKSVGCVSSRHNLFFSTFLFCSDPFPPWVPTRFRIAAEPGLHTFIVRRGTGKNLVKAEVLDGMITPVRITISHIHSKSTAYYNVVTFKMRVGVEKPIPISEYNN